MPSESESVVLGVVVTLKSEYEWTQHKSANPWRLPPNEVNLCWALMYDPRYSVKFRASKMVESN